MPLPLAWALFGILGLLNNLLATVLVLVITYPQMAEMDGANKTFTTTTKAINGFFCKKMCLLHIKVNTRPTSLKTSKIGIITNLLYHM